MAGLTILLSVVTMLFVIGLIVMIFSLMGGELQEATYTASSGSVVNETITWVGGGTVTVATAGTLNFAGMDGTVINNTAGVNNETLVEGVDYSITGAGTISNLTTDSATGVRFSYTYSYDLQNTATNVMNDTTVGIAGVTDWFNIFIVITAMVVLILLTVIIIGAIRGSGMIGQSA